MKRQSSEHSEAVCRELNEELRQVLNEIPVNEKREQTYRALDEDKLAKPKKKMKPMQIVTGALVTVFAVLALCVGTFFGLSLSGKKAMTAASDIDMIAPNIEGQEIEVEEKGSLVVYNGQKYCYNNNMITVLLMGVDQTQDERLEHLQSEGQIASGQADTIILAAMDAETGKTSLINISRDSMVDVDMYTSSGNFGGTDKMQLCLAFAYGKGEKGGSENVARSVSRFLYGIPVNSYAAINLSAIPVLNDAIGGVEVQVLEDLSIVDPALKLGETVTLKGKQAETYVRMRDAYFGGAESNTARMERQKQYMSAFAAKTLARTREDVSVPLTLFDIATEYMVTDLNAAKVSYLVSILDKVGLEESNFVSIAGESVIGKNNYAEFYPDEKALYELILDIFYKRVNE